MIEGSLITATRELLLNRPRTVAYRDIEQATGLKERWLKSMANQEHGKLCATSVQVLYEYLAGRKLDV